MLSLKDIKKLFLVITLFTILTTEISFFSLFHILYKSRPQKFHNILTFPYKFHRLWIRVHFLPPAIVILTFAYFFLTNLAIVRARAYGYVSVYDMITSVIHVTELISLWQYRVIFLFLFDQTIFVSSHQTQKTLKKSLFLATTSFTILKIWIPFFSCFTSYAGLTNCPTFYTSL